MGADVALTLVSRMLWMSMLIMAPLLLLVMVVGVLVSIFQVVTQIQEMSLSFVPKLITVVIVLQVFGPWMLRSLVNYASQVINSIPQYLQ